MSRSIVPSAPVEYPSGDGKPMAENDVQLAAILYGIGALRVHYQDRTDIYVSGDLLMYYEEGNPRVSVAPDVFVVFGVEARVRKHYLVWEEGKAPDFVLEVASKSTWREDLGRKRDLYARLGVKEYWQYDPTGEYFSPAAGPAPGRGCLRAPVGGGLAGRRADPDERDTGTRAARAGRGDALPRPGDGPNSSQPRRGGCSPPGGGGADSGAGGASRQAAFVKAAAVRGTDGGPGRGNSKRD